MVLIPWATKFQSVTFTAPGLWCCELTGRKITSGPTSLLGKLHFRNCSWDGYMAVSVTRVTVAARSNGSYVTWIFFFFPAIKDVGNWNSIIAFFSVRVLNVHKLVFWLEELLESVGRSEKSSLVICCNGRLLKLWIRHFWFRCHLLSTNIRKTTENHSVMASCLHSHT